MLSVQLLAKETVANLSRRGKLVKDLTEDGKTEIKVGEAELFMTVRVIPSLGQCLAKSDR